MKRLLLALMLSFTCSVVFAKTIGKKIYLVDIHAETTTEKHGDELYFMITELNSNGDNRQYTLPHLPITWPSEAIEQIHNLLLWDGDLEDGESSEVIIELVERDAPPFNTDESLGSARVKLENKKGHLRWQWGTTHAETSFTQAATNQGDKQLYNFGGHGGEYTVHFLLLDPDEALAKQPAPATKKVPNSADKAAKSAARVEPMQAKVAVAPTTSIPDAKTSISKLEASSSVAMTEVKSERTIDLSEDVQVMGSKMTGSDLSTVVKDEVAILEPPAFHKNAFHLPKLLKHKEQPAGQQLASNSPTAATTKVAAKPHQQLQQVQKPEAERRIPSKIEQFKMSMKKQPAKEVAKPTYKSETSSIATGEQQSKSKQFLAKLRDKASLKSKASETQGPHRVGVITTHPDMVAMNTSTKATDGAIHLQFPKQKQSKAQATASAEHAQPKLANVSAPKKDCPQCERMKKLTSPFAKKETSPKIPVQTVTTQSTAVLSSNVETALSPVASDSKQSIAEQNAAQRRQEAVRAQAARYDSEKETLVYQKQASVQSQPQVAKVEKQRDFHLPFAKKKANVKEDVSFATKKEAGAVISQHKELNTQKQIIIAKKEMTSMQPVTPVEKKQGIHLPFRKEKSSADEQAIATSPKAAAQAQAKIAVRQAVATEHQDRKPEAKTKGFHLPFAKNQQNAEKKITAVSEPVKVKTITHGTKKQVSAAATASKTDHRFHWLGKKSAAADGGAVKAEKKRFSFIKGKTTAKKESQPATPIVAEKTNKGLHWFSKKKPSAKLKQGIENSSSSAAKANNQALPVAKNDNAYRGKKLHLLSFKKFKNQNHVDKPVAVTAGRRSQQKFHFARPHFSGSSKAEVKQSAHRQTQAVKTQRHAQKTIASQQRRVAHTEHHRMVETGMKQEHHRTAAHRVREQAKSARRQTHVQTAKVKSVQAVPEAKQVHRHAAGRKAIAAKKREAKVAERRQAATRHSAQYQQQQERHRQYLAKAQLEKQRQRAAIQERRHAKKKAEEANVAMDSSHSERTS